MPGVYVAIVSLALAVLVVLARRMITRLISPWARAGAVIGLLYVMLRFAFAAADRLNVQGSEGWILIVGSLMIAAIEAVIWRVRARKRALV